MDNEIEFIHLFQDKKSYNKEDVEIRLTQFFLHSHPHSIKENGFTYLALAMSMQPQIFECLIEKYEITQIQSAIPFTSSKEKTVALLSVSRF
jgi:hypothetical protein